MANNLGINAESIVSNADANFTFLKLVGGEYLPNEYLANLQNMKNTSLHCKLYLGIDGLVGAEYNGMHYFSPKLDDKWIEIFNPAVNDRSRAPENKSIIGVKAAFPFKTEEIKDWKKSKIGF
ncbi:hypothetical protein ACFL52_03495 [Candidatus Margulisiibacteriota bacterium]